MEYGNINDLPIKFKKDYFKGNNYYLYPFNVNCCSKRSLRSYISSTSDNFKPQLELAVKSFRKLISPIEENF
jgi:hypothetical protein